MNCVCCFGDERKDPFAGGWDADEEDDEEGSHVRPPVAAGGAPKAQPALAARPSIDVNELQAKLQAVARSQKIEDDVRTVRPATPRYEKSSENAGR